jgi:molybdate transport system substrate-binding protein
MVAGALWDQADKTGRLKTETKTIMPSSSYAIGMKPGTKASVVGKADDFKPLVEDAQSIAMVDRSPSIPILMQSLGKMGVAQQVEAKTKTYPTGGAIAEALAKSEVDMGITTMSELVAVPQVVVLGPMPSELLPIKATTTAAIVQDSSVPREAAELLHFLTSPSAMAIFKAKGFDAN